MPKQEEIVIIIISVTVNWVSEDEVGTGVGITVGKNVGANVADVGRVVGYVVGDWVTKPLAIPYIT